MSPFQRPGPGGVQRPIPFFLPALFAALSLLPSVLSAEKPLTEMQVIEDKVIAVYTHDLALARARQAILTDPGATAYFLLEMPAGKLTSIKVADSPEYTQEVFPAPGGSLAYCNNEGCYVSRPGAEPRRVEEPAKREPGDRAPILSDDGAWLAWIEADKSAEAVFVEGKGNYRPSSARLRSLKTGKETRLVLPGVMAGDGAGGLPQPLSLDMKSGELTFYANDDRSGNDPQFAAVSLDSKVSWGPVRPEGMSPEGGTFIRIGKGWVAWNASSPVAGKSERPSRKLLKWSLPGADGAYRTGSYQLGRTELLASIRDAAVSPGGKFIAVSVEAGNRLVKFSGSIRIIRAGDGSELFKIKTLAGLSGDIAFLGDEYFAYSKYDDPPGHHRTHVLSLPKEP